VALRSHGKSSVEDVTKFVSTVRAEDGATPLHVASMANQNDAIRTLLVRI
jgi:ankyrin repeat protein